MRLTNEQIYTYATNLFNLSIEVKMPVRINFFLQKNTNILKELVEEIDKAKLEIAQLYGRQVSNDSYHILPENMVLAEQELRELFALEQEVNLHIFSSH